VWRSVSQAALVAENVEREVNRLSRRAMIAMRCAPPLRRYSLYLAATG
jgi:hypothetical protein